MECIGSKLSEWQEKIVRTTTDRGHAYCLLGGTEVVPGITSIIRLAAVPQLQRWIEKTNRLETIKAAWEFRKDFEVFEDFKGAVEDAIEATSAEAIRNRRAGEGSDFHDRLAKHLTGEQTDYLRFADLEIQLRRELGDYEILAVEQKVWGERFGGTMDCLLETPEGRVIVDWKTGKGIWPEYALQLGAGIVALHEMGFEDATEWRGYSWCPTQSKIYSAKELSDAALGFLGLLALYKWKKSVNT